MTYIFIHGLGQEPNMWNETLSYLSDLKENTISVDLSSFLKEEDCSYENLYDNFSEYCNQISGQLNLCGLSLGSILALNYALDYPEKINSLVLIAPQYVMPKTLLKLQNIVFRFIPDSHFQNLGFKKKDFISLTKSMQHLDFRDRVNNISSETLILCGEKDTFNKRAAKRLTEAVTKAELQFIEKAGHEVNKDAPQKLAEVLNDFYRKGSLL